jgi:hypothetical protein
VNNVDTSATLDILREALAKAADPVELAKAATFVQSVTPTVGLQLYDLEPAAKNLYPVLTPLRNRIPRVSGKGGSQANWKGVTGIDTGSIFAGVTEGRRGALISVATKEYFAAYRTIGSEASVTFEADLAAGDFDNLRSRASMSNLQALMIAEEKIILSGNTTYQLGQTPTPVCVAANTGGALAASTTFSVICVALTTLGKATATVATGVVGVTTRQTADGFTDTYNGGSAIKSANGTVATAAGTATNSVAAAVTPVRGAFAYAWFWGAVGSEVLGAITNVANYTITGAATGTQTAASLPALDCSTNSLVFDGLLSIASGSTNGGYYYAAAPGAGLTPDNSGGIIEFDTALQWFWDNLRLAPSRIILSSQEMTWIRRAILTGNAATPSNARFTFSMQQGQIVGGGAPKGYINTFAAGGAPAEIPFELHPYMPPGNVLFLTEDLPYPMNNVTNVMQIKARRDYYQIDWPQITRQYQYGVYSDEVLQHYFPPSMGLITNLSPVL